MSIISGNSNFHKIKKLKNHSTPSTLPYTKREKQNKLQKTIFSQSTSSSQDLPSKKVEQIQNPKNWSFDSFQTKPLNDFIFLLPSTNMDLEMFSEEDLSFDSSDLSAFDDSPILNTPPSDSDLSTSSKSPLSDKENQLDQRDLRNSPSLKPLSESELYPSSDSILSDKVAKEKPSLPARRPLKNSSLHWEVTLNTTTTSGYQDSEKFISDLMKELKTLEVPEEFVTVDKGISETRVTIVLSWRELKALCLKSRKLENLLLNGLPIDRLRPLTADTQAASLVKTARQTLRNNSEGQTTPSWEPSDTSSLQEILTSGYSDFDGICFGEMHDAPKTFLIDHMQHLKTCGVEILFMENLLYDTMQVFLDKYFLDEPDAEMPIPLAAYLKSLDEEYDLAGSNKQGFTALVKAAKRHGIRVVGIDTSLSYEAGLDRYGSGGIDRYLAMNHVAKQIMEWEAGATSKYAALMGCYHGATATATGKGISISAEDSVPGVAEMLRVPFVILETHDKNVNVVKQDVSNYNDSISFVNMVISGYQSE